MKTIFDFKKVGEKLKRNWKKPYLLVGCPFRETARAILWALRVRSVQLNDALSWIGIPVLFLGPLWCALHPSYPGPWWFWLGLLPLITFLGYGPLDGFGERLHGDPFAPGGSLSKKEKK